MLVDSTGASKVDELCGGGVGDNDVLELEVQVHNVVGVQVVQGLADMAETTAQKGRRQGCGGCDLIEHVSGRCVVHDEGQGEL